MKHNTKADQILSERFGRDSLIALATVEDGLPHVRTVDAVYIDGVLFSNGTRYDIEFGGNV